MPGLNTGFIRRLIALLAVSVFPCVTSAQGTARASVADFPAKPVRMIVPLAPGGGSDIVGRIVALELTHHWQQSVVVDNRPGAGSTVGTALAAKAPADGYTVLVSSSSIAISPALYRNLGFDVRNDFAGISLLASQPSILAVQAGVTASTVAELLTLAKAQPGKLTYASAGSGSATHLGTELLKHSAAIDLLHVPYKSAGLAMNALVGGETHVLLTNMASVLPHLKSGRIKALGISSAKRSPLAPDLPTIAESGVPGYEYSTWYAMLAPAGTPKPIVSRVHADLARILKTPRMHDKLSAQGLEVHASSPAELEAYLQAEIIKWERVVRAANVRAE